MNVYQYIASNNPFVARNIIESFGYSPTSSNLAYGLEQLVNQEGEQALIRIIQNHPDRDIIIEMNEQPIIKKEKSSCGCNSKKSPLEYLNAIGGTSEARHLSLQTNTFLLASALILAVAIISKH